MADYQVQVVFDDGTNEYTFPLVQSVIDNKEGMKAVVIEGNRADGSIVIPGGKRSQEITIKGILFDADGYKDLTTLMDELREKVTTDIATLTLQHFDGTWITDWQYTVRRITEIEFAESFRTGDQEYTVRFIVLSY